MHEQTQRNLDYYDKPSEGRADYWRHMPAPRFRAHVIRETLSQAAPRSVVDLGCGDGSMLAALQSALPGATFAGIDLAESQIADNKRTKPELEWYAGNLEDDLTLPRRFEAITASEVIEHLADPARFLRSIHKIAEPNALLILTTQSGRIGETEKCVGHTRHFSRDEMTQLLQETGWTPVRVWNAGFPFQDLSKWGANLSPHGTMHHFGGKPYGAMQKMVSAVLRFLFLFNSNTRGAQLFAVARRAAA